MRATFLTSQTPTIKYITIQYEDQQLRETQTSHTKDSDKKIYL